MNKRTSHPTIAWRCLVFAHGVAYPSMSRINPSHASVNSGGCIIYGVYHTMYLEQSRWSDTRPCLAGVAANTSTHDCIIYNKLLGFSFHY